MKTITLFMLLTALAFTETFGQQPTSNLAEPRAEFAESDKIIMLINSALDEVKQELQSGSAPIILQSAEVKFETGLDHSGGGGFKIFVKASRKWTKGVSNSVSYKYDIPEAIVKAKSQSADLVKIIKNAAASYRKSLSITGMKKNGFIVEIAITVNVNSSGGVEFEVFGIGIDGDIERERLVGHTITLEFK